MLDDGQSDGDPLLDISRRITSGKVLRTELNLKLADSQEVAPLQQSMAVNFVERPLGGSSRHYAEAAESSETSLIGRDQKTLINKNMKTDEIDRQTRFKKMGCN